MFIFVGFIVGIYYLSDDVKSKKATNNMKILCQIRMQILHILNSRLDKI